jgi:hypothetical protein
VSVLILVAIAVVIALGAAALAVRARKAAAASHAVDDHAEWLHQVARAATGLNDLPRVEAEHL